MINLSGEPAHKLHAWLPHGLAAGEIVFLPDACPGRSPLPAGIAIKLDQPDWRRFAVSDAGCGMRLLRSSADEIRMKEWNEVARLLKANKGKTGDLGGGNHFLDGLLPYSGKGIHFLIHTGSRHESGLVDAYVDDPAKFDQAFDHAVRWACDNRAGVQQAAEQVFGKMDLILDLPHNTMERLPDGGVIIRKGAVKVMPGEMNIIPSNLGGDVSLVRATGKVGEILHSLSHGTGRIVPRGGCKAFAGSYDFLSLRKRVLIPDCIRDVSLKTEGPYAYRELDRCLDLLSGFVEETERFSVVAYMGHL